MSKEKVNDLIVQSRDLINSTYDFETTDAMRILNLALSKVDSRQPNPGTIKVHAKDYVLAYGVNEAKAYSMCREAVKALVNSTIKLTFDGVSEEDKFKEINWLGGGSFDHGEAELSFSPEVSKYLFEIKERFVTVSLRDAAAINSSFAFRLYQNLLQYETDPSKRDGDCFVVELSIEQILKMCPSRSYGEFSEINKKIIKPAILKINETQAHFIGCEPVKYGKSITALKFRCVSTKSLEPTPTRPRLARRPKVAEGSQLEREWARKNRDLLIEYCQKVHDYYDGDMSCIRMDDIKRIVEMGRIIGDSKVPYIVQVQLEKRLRKRF